MRNTMQAKIAERLSAAVQWINAEGTETKNIKKQPFGEKPNPVGT